MAETRNNRGCSLALKIPFSKKIRLKMRKRLCKIQTTKNFYRQMLFQEACKLPNDYTCTRVVPDTGRWAIQKLVFLKIGCPRDSWMVHWMACWLKPMILHPPFQFCTGYMKHVYPVSKTKLSDFETMFENINSLKVQNVFYCDLHQPMNTHGKNML